MPRDKHATIRKMTERYGLAGGEVAAMIEREVIGGVFGANGFTTLAQARALIAPLRLRPGVRLLDIGAGRGWPGLFLAGETGCQTVLADVPFPGLRTAMDRRDELGLGGLVGICRATGTHPPFAARSFDALVHTDTL